LNIFSDYSPGGKRGRAGKRLGEKIFDGIGAVAGKYEKTHWSACIRGRRKMRQFGVMVGDRVVASSRSV